MAEFKRLVKIISFADMVISCLTATLLGVFLFYVLFFTPTVHISAGNTGDGDVSFIDNTAIRLFLTWFFVIITIMTTTVKIRAAYKLHKACKIETSPKDSYLLCKSWKKVNIFFLCINILNCFLGYGKFSLSVIILYIVPLYVVHGYMRELLAIEERQNESIIADVNDEEKNISEKFDELPNVSFGHQSSLSTVAFSQYPNINEGNQNTRQWT